MSLVIRPLHKIGELCGHDLILKSKDPTQNFEKFMKDCEEVRLQLENAEILPKVAK